MLVKLLAAVSPSLREIAREVGISYGAVRQYRLGQRTPSPKVLRRLVAVVRARSEKLAELAAELERAAEKPQKP